MVGAAPGWLTTRVYGPGARFAVPLSERSAEFRAGPSATVCTVVPVLSSTPTWTDGSTVDPPAAESVSVSVDPVDARLVLPAAVPPGLTETPLNTVGTCEGSLMERL